MTLGSGLGSHARVMLGAAKVVNGDRASKKLQRAIRTAFLTPLLKGIACNIQRRPNTHNRCQRADLLEKPGFAGRKDINIGARIMKNNLFNLRARFNGNVPRMSQGESRGDFWTLQ